MRAVSPLRATGVLDTGSYWQMLPAASKDAIHSTNEGSKRVDDVAH